MALADILTRIAEDAAAEAAARVAEARAAAERTVADARAEAEREAASTLERGRREAEAEGRSLVASARLAARDARLGAQRDLVARALAEAQARLLALPDDAYTAFIARGVADAARGGETVLVAEADRDRLAGLPDAVARLETESGRSSGVVFGGGVAEGLAHGVVLKGSRTQAEVSPAQAIETRRDELEMLAASILFGGEA